MFVRYAPAPPLAGYVSGYWFVQDLPGVYEGAPIRTAPFPGAVLSINIGRPNQMVGGPVAPRLSLLGLQTEARSWRSWDDTYFVMAMLTAPGLARLFPDLGPACRDALLDLSGLLGDGTARALADAAGAAWSPSRVAPILDRWLTRRLERVAPPPDFAGMAAAYASLRRSGRVARAAAEAELSRRRMHRWFRRHLKLAPKAVADLGRLNLSLRAAQDGEGDPVEGFSDQADQIRSWRRRLGVTPGRYARGAPSPMASFFGGVEADGPAFYL